MGTPVATLQETFDDEFTSNFATDSSPNGTVGWETRLPFYADNGRTIPATGEADYYSDPSVGENPFSTNNGVLSITASLASVTGANPLGEPANSGAITTYDSFSQEYGYWEISAKLPAGNGLWSAFWLAPTSLSGQSELDALEVLGNDPSQVYATTHSMVNGVFVPNLQQINTANTSTGFHTYGIDWEPNTITWYMDGQEIATAPTPSNMNESMFTILNLVVGSHSSWPGAPTSSSEFPASMQIDYVRAYATANTEYVSGTDAIGLGAPEGEGSITGYSAVGIGAGTPLPGTVIKLLNSSGTVIATTTTDVHGAYQFIDLTPGTYTVTQVTPSGYVPQPGSTGSTSVTVTTGGAEMAAVLKLANNVVTGSVLLGGTAQSGVTVSLLNSAGTSTVATTTTNSSGVFTFSTVPVGHYLVHYTAPTGEALSSGPANNSTGLTNAISVTGATLTLAAETLVPAAPVYATLTGSVLFAGAGEANVTVAVLASNGTTVATTTTNSNGTFTFNTLAAGSYQVQYTAPAGDEFQYGGPADTTTGLTGTYALTAGTTTTVPAEDLLLPISVAMTGSHPSFVGGNGAYIITGSSPVAAKVTVGNGDQSVNLGGWGDVVTLGSGDQDVTLSGSTATLSTGNGAQTISLTSNFDKVTIGDTTAGKVSTINYNGQGDTISGGDGSVNVTGQGVSATVTLGDGNHTISLTGSYNTVTLGTGQATVNLGSNSGTVHTAGGGANVTVSGAYDTVDLGAGTNTVNSTARLSTFMLNGSGQGLTTINGFTPLANNALDLTRTLAGVDIAGDLSNLSNYITSSVSSGSTTLFVDPTGGAGTPYAFVTLQGVSTSVSALLAAHDFKVG